MSYNREVNTFRLSSKYQPTGDQPAAIAQLADGLEKGEKQQTLLGVQQERLQAWIALNRATGGAAQYQGETSSSASAALAPTTSVH